MLHFLVLAGAGIAALAFALVARAKGNDMQADKSGMSPPTQDELFQKYGERYGVDPMLLKAVAMQESSLNANAIRNNPPNDISVGLMQVLCIPDSDGVCTNRRPEISGWDGVTFEMLKDQETNIRFGAEILSAYQQRFGFLRGIAAYNSKSARTAPEGGPFPNQHYVNRIIANYRKLTGKDLV